MPFVLNYVYEILKTNNQAYVSIDSIFPRQDSIWVMLESHAEIEPSEEYNVSVKYADTPGVLIELDETAKEQVKEKILDYSKTVHYDLVGYHLDIRPGCMLPVKNFKVQALDKKG